MSLYKRGDVWWYKFRFGGQLIRESSKSESKTIARDAERVRRRGLEESWNQIKRRKLPPPFAIAAADWLKVRTSIAPSTERSYKLAISQLSVDFGRQLLCDISAEDLAAYQMRRKRDGVSNRTVNLEVGVLRGILRRNKMWEPLSADVDFLKESPSPGRALSSDEERFAASRGLKSIFSVRR
jgi:hypothetical protein